MDRGDWLERHDAHGTDRRRICLSRHEADIHTSFRAKYLSFAGVRAMVGTGTVVAMGVAGFERARDRLPALDEKSLVDSARRTPLRTPFPRSGHSSTSSPDLTRAGAATNPRLADGHVRARGALLAEGVRRYSQLYHRLHRSGRRGSEVYYRPW
jgi:hypothetical protein